MYVESFFERLQDIPNSDAIIDDGVTYSYKNLIEKINEIHSNLYVGKIWRGSVVGVVAEPSFYSIAIILALIQRGAIVVPRLWSTPNLVPFQLADLEWVIDITSDSSVTIGETNNTNSNPLYERLRLRSLAGLVIFTTGTTGKQKGIVHVMERVLKKFERPRRAYRMISFLQYDHFGGINTILYALTSGSCLIIPKDRAVDTVLAAVDEHKATLLPVTPSFLKYMAMERVWNHYKLPSLELITYGSERMESGVLTFLSSVLPDVEFRQTYGLSELGVLHAKSKSSDSLWVKVGGPGFETKVEAGTLRVKSESSMLGYLDGGNPFNADGWYDTGDLVDVDGEYVRFRGRRDDE